MPDPSSQSSGRQSTPSAPSVPRRAPSMAIAFRTLWRTLRHGYENLGTLAMVSILWMISAVLVLPLGTATAALHRVVKPMTEERATGWRDFFTHLRADLRWASILFVILILGFGLLLFNIPFYAASPSVVLRGISVLFITLLIVWLGISLFAYPLALRQTESNLRTTFRNAALMTMANAPGVLITLVLLTAFVIICLLLPPLFVLIPGIVALWGQENARLLLVASGYLAKDEVADRERGEVPAERPTKRRRNTS